MMAALTTQATAQSVKIGIRGGIETGTMSFDNKLFESSNRVGWFIGPTIKASLIGGLGADISGLYNQRDSKVTVDDDYNITMKQKQIIVPVNVRYAIGLGSVANIFVFGGPQVSFRLGDEEKIYNEVGQWRLKSSTMSVNVGAGVTISKIQVTANYNVALGTTGEMTLDNAWQGARDGWEGKNRSWQVSAAYFF